MGIIKLVVMADKVFSEIAAGGAQLKHAETVDKSAPVIEGDVKIGKNSHGDLMKEVEGGAQLKHAETVDKSAPVIEKDVTVGESKRPALLAEIQAKGRVNSSYLFCKQRII